MKSHEEKSRKDLMTPEKDCVFDRGEFLENCLSRECSSEIDERQRI